MFAFDRFTKRAPLCVARNQNTRKACSRCGRQKKKSASGRAAAASAARPAHVKHRPKPVQPQALWRLPLCREGGPFLRFLKEHFPRETRKRKARLQPSASRKPRVSLEIRGAQPVCKSLATLSMAETRESCEPFPFLGRPSAAARLVFFGLGKKREEPVQTHNVPGTALHIKKDCVSK